ncbi:MAG: S8 family serine peptidase [Bdellovibrionales bacterium]
MGTISAAIRYAVDRKANIINLSLGAGGARPHPALISAANYAEQKGALLVVAAGNGDQTGLGFDIEKIPVWPARLLNENIVTVAAFDSNNVLSPYSNFGAVSVDVVAPGGFTGDPMVSCAYENTQGALLIGLMGTSMAAPVVSGIAADLWSKNPGLNHKEIRELLIASGTSIPQLQPVTVSGKHIDALSALQLAVTKNVLF